MKPTRILLDATTSAAIRAAGDCFVVISKASHPDDPARVALHIIPSTIDLADRATAVAQGRLLTRKPPKAKA